MPYKDPEARRAYEKEWRAKNGVKCREKARRHYHNDRPRQVARVRQWQNENPEKFKAGEQLRKGWRGAKHGLKRGEYERMLEEQDHRCALCDDELDPKHTHIDHDHHNGEVRGLLCRPCNVGLGMFHDDPDEMRRAIAYLEKSWLKLV